jgi:(2Fe-2S) ferredoxin
MMGLFKGLTQEIQNKPWTLLSRKCDASCEASPGEEGLKKAKGFCDPESKKPCITVCTPKPGCQCDSAAVRQALKDQIEALELNISIGSAKTGCAGSCKDGPFIGFPQKGFFYLKVHPENVSEVVQETLINGRILFPYVSIGPDRSYRADLLYDKNTGLLAAIDDSVCMVEAAKYFLDFEDGLSCGKCVPCRIGMKRMQECLERIVAGKGTDRDLEDIQALCRTMKHTPHCAFAMTSSNPVLAAVTHFEEEFKAHIQRKECRAGVCKELVELQRKKEIREKLRKKK